MDKYTVAEEAFKNGVRNALKGELLQKAICNATQQTPYRCSQATKAMCKPGSGDCYYCEEMADAIRKEILTHYGL